MIFGLALSVGAISLVGAPPSTTPQLVSDISIFAFSFALIIIIWLRYTRIMSALPLNDTRAIILNLMLLFCVSLEPFLFETTKSALDLNVTTAAYALDLGTMYLILGAFSLVLADEERKLIPKELVRQYRSEGIASIVTGLFFLVSLIIPVPDNNGVPLVIYGIPLIIRDVPLRVWLWIAPLVLSAFTRQVVRISSKRERKTTSPT
jgi:uncharacterized membrane protein